MNLEKTRTSNITSRSVGGLLYLVSMSLLINVTYALLIVVGMSIEQGLRRTARTMLSTWYTLITEGSWFDAVIRMCHFFAPLVLGLLAVYLLVLLFTRNQNFPRYYVVIHSIFLVWGCLNFIYNYIKYPHEFVEWFAFILIFPLNLLVGIIWIPYILKSQRVRNTF